MVDYPFSEVERVVRSVVREHLPGLAQADREVLETRILEAVEDWYCRQSPPPSLEYTLGTARNRAAWDCLNFFNRRLTRLELTSWEAPVRPGDAKGETIGDSVADANADPADAYLRTELRVSVWRDLERIDQRYAAVIRLRHLERRSVAETAEALSLRSVGTVKSREHRGLALLRRLRDQ